MFARAEQALDGDEDDAGEEQVEQEPIEAEVNVASTSMRSCACEPPSTVAIEHERERGEAEDLLLAEHDADDAQHERGDEAQVEREADRGRRCRARGPRGR